ncbi:5'-flap endonuclease [Ascosphaera atra]|nr:5'-flap endonuclease [Ascosphaera atra]
MPNFNDRTPEALAEELSAYGLKPIKSRKKAIEVLEECWKNTHKGPPRSTQQRPQAVGADQTAPLTGEMHSSKPAMDDKSVSSLTEDPTQSQRSTNSTAPSTAVPDLAEQLTKAIQSQPKVSTETGEKQLRWHEKILLYDPIQVDELTVWLNTGGLDNIGEDREVSPAFVKEWCENKGICCIWK